MKNRSKMLTSFAVAMALPGMFALTADAEGTGDAGAAADPAAVASAAEARKRAPASNFLPIVRGRLPLLFVHAIRFDPVLNAMGNKDLATKFATSVGKVFDIKKGRNFTYVKADFVPSAEDVTASEGWIAQVGKENAKGLATSGDTALMQKTLDDYKAKGLATPEQVAALSANRAASRPPKAPAANGVAAGAAAAAVGTSTAGQADDLLS